MQFTIYNLFNKIVFSKKILVVKYACHITPNPDKSKNQPSHAHLLKWPIPQIIPFAIYLAKLSSRMIAAASLTASISLSVVPVGQFRLIRVLQNPFISISFPVQRDWKK